MNRLLTLLLFSCLLTASANGQIKKWYTTSGGELIFSFADIEDGNATADGSKLRFSAVLHVQSWANYNFSEKAGFFTGVSVRNVGFITENNTTNQKKKFRTYNLGIPIGLKIGDMSRGFIYGGYELEIPFNYKEKTFEGDDKVDKFSVWFSDRTEPLMHTAFVGYQFRNGGNLKFKYYLNNFFNQDFSENIAGEVVRPYEDVNVNMFYVSLSFNLFHNTKVYYKSDYYEPRE